MTELSTSGQIIEVARRFLVDVDNNARIADEIRAGERRLPTNDEQNVIRTAVASRIWRREGRQVLVMHPAVVAEVAVASSDKIPGEVLRTLPYLSPLVLYAVPPEFKTWAKPGDADTYVGETMRLLGFFTFSHSLRRPAQQPNMYDALAACHYNTHDPRGEKFGVAAFFDVLDASRRRVDTEYSTLGIPFSTAATLAETVEEQLNAYRWMGGGDDSSRRSWMRGVMSTIIGSVFYLCSTTLEAEPIPRKQAAKITAGLGRKPPTVLQVGWRMGVALTRLRQRRESGDDGLGMEQGPQHRRGHFRMQPYGPRRSLRKLIYVSPYWTHVEQLADQGVTITHRVPIPGPPGVAREAVRVALEAMTES